VQQIERRVVSAGNSFDVIAALEMLRSFVRSMEPWRGNRLNTLIDNAHNVQRTIGLHDADATRSHSL